MNWFHPFHLVDPSPWPILCSFSAISVVVSVVGWLQGSSFLITLLSVVALMCGVTQWWRDVLRESTVIGFHTLEVCNGLYIGFCIFIASEVMFFFSFFFGYFFIALSPDPWIGGWPPVGLQPVSFIGVPLSNTVLLLSSGVSVTWAHHSILSSNNEEYLPSMLITIVLAVLFIIFQYEEYNEMSFTISDSVFGSLFFIMTGFHGLHVIVGLAFLLVSFYRGWNGLFTNVHHLGFEFSAWYWHFVDVVWLFLFLVVYWWGS